MSWSFASAVVQIVMLAVAMALHGGAVSMDENPMLGPHYYILDVLGAKNVARIKEFGEWWRLLTPMLLHTGVLHLIGNLLVQLRTGSQLEYMWGHTQWLLIYIVSGIYATLCSCVLLPEGLSVGSSGALCGLVGAWLAFMLITWNQTSPYDKSERDQQVVSVGVSILLIIALSFLPLMDFGAHIGGMVAGAALSMAMFAGRLQIAAYRLATRIVGVVSVVTFGLFLIFWLLFVTEVDTRLLHLCGPRQEC